MAKDLGGGGTTLSSYKVDFDQDVAPILRQAIAVGVDVRRRAVRPHDPGRGSRAPRPGCGAALSDPAQPNTVRQIDLQPAAQAGHPGATPSDDMPRLLGDDPYDKYRTKRLGLSLTVTQYAILRRWATGAFLGSALRCRRSLDPAGRRPLSPRRAWIARP